MGNVALMAVVDGLDDLAPEEFSFKFGHLPVRLYFKITMKRASVYVLHDQEHLLVALKRLI